MVKFRVRGRLWWPSLFLYLYIMLIQPVDTPQQIQFRARPHTTTGDYLLVCWTNSQKAYCLIESLTYGGGSVYGAVSFPTGIGYENGTKINFRAFPVIDALSLVEAFENINENDPFFATIETVNVLLLDEQGFANIDKEIYRGQIFVRTETEQPYSLT